MDVVEQATELDYLRRIADAVEEWALDRVPRDYSEEALLRAFAEYDRWRRGATVEDDIRFFEELGVNE